MFAKCIKACQIYLSFMKNVFTTKRFLKIEMLTINSINVQLNEILLINFYEQYVGTDIANEIL